MFSTKLHLKAVLFFVIRIVDLNARTGSIARHQDALIIIHGYVAEADVFIIINLHKRADESAGDVKHLDALRSLKRPIGYDDVVVGKEEDSIGTFHGPLAILANLQVAVFKK